MDDFNGYARENETDIGAKLWTADCTWGEWDPWGHCNETCGVGVQTRTRTQMPPINNGLNCTDPLLQLQYSIQPCIGICKLENIMLPESGSVVIDSNTNVYSGVVVPQGVLVVINGDLTIQQSGNIFLNSSNIEISGNFVSSGNLTIYNSAVLVKGCIDLSGILTIHPDYSFDSEVIFNSTENCLNGKFDNVSIIGLPPCTTATPIYTTSQMLITFFHEDCSTPMNLPLIIGCSVAGICVLVAVSVGVLVAPLRKKLFPFREQAMQEKRKQHLELDKEQILPATL